MQPIYSTKKVFRYRSFNEKSLTALKEGKLFFSTPEFFNDPFDSVTYVDNQKIIASINRDITEGVKSGYLARRIMEKGLDPTSALNAACTPEVRGQFFAQVRYAIELFRNLLIKNAKIICFAPNPDSVLMWSHYADYHKGFVLEYDTEELKSAQPFDENGNELKRELYLDKVQYDDQVPDCGEIFYNRVPHYLKNIEPLWDERLCYMHLFHKLKDWAYEQEWRMWSVRENYDWPDEVKYLKIKPRAVIMGTRMDEANRKTIADAVAGQGIELYVAQRNLKSASFRLDIVPYGEGQYDFGEMVRKSMG